MCSLEKKDIGILRKRYSVDINQMKEYSLMITMITITMPYPPLKCYLFTVVKDQAQVKMVEPFILTDM